ncbi:MAG: hypothetical protein IPG04_26615 [Polyangiaceae bacterium]|jgi:hypothetical protein|nr:hypothetical protein [Polyangiaceae bacterium]
MLRFGGVLTIALAAAACGGEGSTATTSGLPALASTAPAAAQSASGAAAVFDPTSAAECAARRAEVQKQPAVPGAPKVADKAVGFTRVRSRALLWKSAPKVSPQVERMNKAKQVALRLVRTARDLMDQRDGKADRRKVVLAEGGYLFASEPLVALALMEQASLPKLFDEETVYLQRGVEVYELAHEPETKLEKERFVYKGGPFDGEKAELLFGDRVAVTRAELEAQPSLVVDLRDLMSRSEFDRVKPVHMTDNALVAEVRYGPGAWVPALFEIKGPKLELACEALSQELSTKKAKFVDENRPRRLAMERVRETVRQMVREKIPFDAAADQKMGFLRKAWHRAYMAGWRSFNYEGKSREVYSSFGTAKPPQVCIDFLTDTWERASGKWFQPAKPGDPIEPQPKQLQGAIDFDSMGVENRRSVAQFAEFAMKKKDVFEVWEIPKKERIPFKQRDEFYAYLHDKQDMFRPGDMITVHGYKEGGRPHYHSLIILEQDPVTGVPTLVAGNAVFPREQSLEGILQISPKRSLKHRIRIKDEWLAKVAGAKGDI